MALRASPPGSLIAVGAGVTWRFQLDWLSLFPLPASPGDLTSWEP